MSLILSTMRLAVVKSERLRFRVRLLPWLKPLGTARSTEAPPGIRPAEGTLTVILEPSRPSASKPPTTRLPWAMA
ncbi:hypothetical protein D3C80_1653690 [compost metagenome]